MNLSETQIQQWRVELERLGFTEAEARAWVAGMVNADRLGAAKEADMAIDEWEVHKRVAADKFRDAARMHLLMFGPPGEVQNPDQALAEFMRVGLDPTAADAEVEQANPYCDGERERIGAEGGE